MARNGAIEAVRTEGHSGYAAKGEDIVCASISSLMQALWVGLDEILRLDGLSAERDEKIPMMALAWDARIPDAQILARSIARALALVAEAYPEHVEYREIKE